jgi:biotin synthase
MDQSDQRFYLQLETDSIEGRVLASETCRKILCSDGVELLSLLNAAYAVRKRYAGKGVSVHILNNAQNGFCPEDCHYCPQAQSSQADIEEYPMKPDAEILAEAKTACERGAFRYCMVFSGRGPSQKHIEHLALLVREIKSAYPLEVCVSIGIIDEEKARVLKEAGLDRLNHNLNTTKDHYPRICTTHTYADRVNTLKAARRAGMQVCSGVIIGMGETPEDIYDMALTLREMEVESLPVNFYIPVAGAALGSQAPLSPEYCLRVLCLFRFLNPTAEIRIAAGREMYLRGMEVMAFYPANSLFLDGYLNVKGAERVRTLQMIKDAGFSLESGHSIDEILGKERARLQDFQKSDFNAPCLKKIADLRPHMRLEE